MAQLQKSHTSLTVTLGSDRVSATLAHGASQSGERLAAGFKQHPETEILELLIMGCAYNFVSSRRPAPQHSGG